MNVGFITNKQEYCILTIYTIRIRTRIFEFFLLDFVNEVFL